MKRFYETATVAAADGGYQIMLDGRQLKSPAKRSLTLPSVALAEAVASEWRAQGEKILPKTMTMMTLAATAVDRVTPQRNHVVDGIAAYAGTDLLCYPAEGPADLVARQNSHWPPLLDWLAARHGAQLAVADSLMPLRQSPQALARVRAAIDAHDDFELVALHAVTSAAGSVVVALAMLDGHLDGERAFTVSQLDESYQIERWGLDEEAEKRRDGLRAAILDAAKFVQVLRH